MTGVFSQWQPAYAERGIATFPCKDTKTPAVRNYHRFGLPGSTELASRFGAASAFGFMGGKRSGITPLDVDTTDERVLADAMDRHGKTPVVVRSGSGKWHAWYKHNGEPRKIRPWPGLPIDLLGGGVVIAPPSQVQKGQYQFVQGSLDDFDRVPTLQNLDLPTAESAEWSSKREGEGRNGELFRRVGRAAHSVDDFEQLLDYARTQNSQFGEPLMDAEVIKVANSVWKMHCEGRNRFGQFGSYVPLWMVKDLATTNPDALALYNVLKAHNGPKSIFPIANGMADTVIAFGRYRLANARKLLVERGLVEQVAPQTQHQPAFYRWPSRSQGADD